MNGRCGKSGMAPAPGDLLPGAGERAEHEAHGVPAWGHGNRTEQNVCPQQFRRLAIDLCEPPGMPDVVENHPAAIGAVRLHDNFGVAVAHDPYPARLARRRGCRRG